MDYGQISNTEVYNFLHKYGIISKTTKDFKEEEFPCLFAAQTESREMMIDALNSGFKMSENVLIKLINKQKIDYIVWLLSNTQVPPSDSYIAAAIKTGNIRMVLELLKFKCPYNRETIPLAIKLLDLEMVKVLLKAIPNNCNEFVCAIMFGNFEIIKFFYDSADRSTINNKVVYAAVMRLGITNSIPFILQLVHDLLEIVYPGQPHNAYNIAILKNNTNLMNILEIYGFPLSPSLFEMVRAEPVFNWLSKRMGCCTIRAIALSISMKSKFRLRLEEMNVIWNIQIMAELCGGLFDVEVYKYIYYKYCPDIDKLSIDYAKLREIAINCANYEAVFAINSFEEYCWPDIKNNHV